MATPPDAVTRAHALIRDGRTGEAAEVLRVAADDGGNAFADRELGRLLALRRDQAFLRLEERWEAEERLIRSGGGDPRAACALINLYAMASAEIRRDYAPDSWDPREEEKAARLAYCRDRATEQYNRALASAPPNGTAVSAMVAFLYDEWNWHQDLEHWEDPEEEEDARSRLFNELASAAEQALALNSDDAVAATALVEASLALGNSAPAQPAVSNVAVSTSGLGYFSFSLVALGEKHGDQFGEFEETIIASDPVDLLWAVPGMACLDAELDFEPGHLAIYRPGRHVESLTQPDGADLLSWLREVVPDLPEPVMPNGQPVASWSAVERYGYNATGTDR